jgi:hypothetical protein
VCALAIAEFTARWQAIRYPEEKPKSIRDLHGPGRQLKGVRDVPNPDPLTVNQDPNHVKTVGLARTAMPLDPGGCRACEFALLTPVHSLDGVAEVGPVPSFDLNERDKAFAFDDEIDVPMPGAITAL